MRDEYGNKKPQERLAEVYGAARQQVLVMTKNCQVSDILKIHNPRSGGISTVRD